MQFLRTLFIIILILYGMRILGRIFGPFLMRFASKKVEKKFRERYEQQYNRQQNNPGYQEGETIVEPKHKASSSKNSSEKVGEYIDFEEID
ncbi:DUF4834 family protein [Robertkochia sediminum]|uniref:DUF4834 family protein n=1 Tax=Robertkochia sediminum TaxID=2785326 RepID=UPI001932F1D4|nr:DUF4834 family protein [Robertkochia sediminum]MBL7473444.1 DUF4834 family protein [Robertkochia sediminum]